MRIKQLSGVPAPVLLATLLLVGCVGPTGPTVEPTVPSTTAPTHTPAFHPTATASATPAPPLPSPTAVPKLTLELLQNAEYRFAPGERFRLVNGIYYLTPVPGGSPKEAFVRLEEPVRFGDLNGDGVEDAVVILKIRTGGTGIFRHLAVVLNRDGHPDNVATVWLGDRIVVKAVRIQSGQISLDVITHGPDDPLCCPRLKAVWRFKLAGDELVRLPDAVVTALALNMRAGPGTEYKILDSYKRGVALEVLGKSPDGDWLKVRAPDGNVGWMALSYLQLNRPLADVEVVEVPPASVKIVRCRDEWFFAGGPDECPGGPAIMSAGAEEHFEHGVMIWVGALDRIYVLYGDGMYPRWEVFPDDFEEGMPESDPTIVPPPGLYQPIRGFGKVWREKPWVRVRLGWAVNREVGFKTAVQFTSRNVTYIRALDGGLWKLQPEAGGWSHVP